MDAPHWTQKCVPAGCTRPQRTQLIVVATIRLAP
ncbi:MAG: hypothetical protein RL669_1549, partial [Pseudomonadota bacterium]